MQDTLLITAKFASSHANSFLETILLFNNNKILSIADVDFVVLKYSKVKTLHIDSVSLSKIDQNTFVPLVSITIM